MKYLRNKILNWLVKDLFSGITSNDILKFIPNEKGNCFYLDEDKGNRLKGNLFLKGKVLDDDKVDQINDDSEKFANSVIWKLLTDDAKYHANHIMFEKSQSYDDMLFGKALLYLIDILEKRLKRLSNLK